jgi:hypothetical protein
VAQKALTNCDKSCFVQKLLSLLGQQQIGIGFACLLILTTVFANDDKEPSRQRILTTAQGGSVDLGALGRAICRRDLGFGIGAHELARLSTDGNGFHRTLADDFRG